MGKILRAAEVSARALGLSFNLRKCATLHQGAKGPPIPAPIQLADEHLPVVEHGDSYLHFGVPTGVGTDSYSAIDQLIADVGAINASLLNILVATPQFFAQEARSHKDAVERGRPDSPAHGQELAQLAPAC